MSLPSNTATILKAAGFEPMLDFNAVCKSGNEISIEWLSVESRPTDEQIIGWGNSSLTLPNGQWLAVQNMKRKISALRYEKEIGGITVGEQPVSTNRDEMPIWQGMLLDMTMRPGATATYEYKPRNGINTTLTAQQVQRVYECFAWYVQACFATERQLIAAIDAGTPLEQVETMLESVWPQTQFEWTAPTT